MTYAVKEIFATLQGEGINAGRAAVFCRFAGCNLWSGRGADREGATCQFCDTDFVGADGVNGGRFADAKSLAEACARVWGPGDDYRFIVLTGGEPALQVDQALVAALRNLRFVVAIETNGTRELPRLDWVCVSPKAGAPLVVERGDELKLVHPQLGVDPASFEALRFDHFLLQPMDGPRAKASLAACVAYCLAHPRWRLSLQTHKTIGIP